MIDNINSTNKSICGNSGLEETVYNSCNDEISDNIPVLSDNEWATERAIDELECNLASVKQTLTNKTGQILNIRKYQSQCRRLARWIPVVDPAPEYVIDAADLTPETRQHLKKLSHPELERIVCHQAVIRLFESVGFATSAYLNIGRRLNVKIIWD